MEPSPGELMERRPLNARATADVAGTWSLMEASGPTMMTRKSTSTEGARHGPSPRQPKQERLGPRRDAPAARDGPTVVPLQVRRLLVP